MSAVSESDAVLFSVCDQPWLSRGSVKKILDDAQKYPDCIISLAYHGRRGNPVLFPRKYFPELLALSGDNGGAPVIRRHLPELHLMEASSERELWDLDKPVS